MIKLRKKHTISLISIALCFVFLSGGIQNVMGASYEAWPDDPNEPHVWSWKSPEGYLYLARYRLDMNTAEGTKSNEPIMITPWFPDNYATLDSCRIVYENNTGTANEYVEIPYFPESSVNYSSGCLKTATIKFVAPELSGIYYLLFSNNETFQPPSYSMEKIPTIENNILNNVFYDGKYKDSHNIRFNSAGNKTISFLVPKSSEVDDVNITEARFNYSASPIFKETSNIQLDNRYNGMGPASVKFINGTAWNNYTNPYLLIGGPNNAYIYQYQKDNQDFYNIATIDSGSPGNLVSGLTAGNIIGADGSDLELVFGKKDGDVEIYNFDGNWDSSPTLGYTTYVNGTEKFKKPYGLSVLNVINASYDSIPFDVIIPVP